MTFSFFTLEDLLLFFFLTLRVGAIVMTLPFLGSRNLPGHLKILGIFFLSVGLYPAVQAQSFTMPQSLLHLGLLTLEFAEDEDARFRRHRLTSYLV